MRTEDGIERNPQRVIAIRLLTVVGGVVLLFLILRIGMLALGGDPSNLWVQAVLAVTGPFVEPIRALLRFPGLPNSGPVLDTAAIAALIVWAAFEAFVLVYLAPRIDAKRIDWPAEFDSRYGTLPAIEDDGEKPDQEGKE
jgi:uncharacterized protein YggT (Ycf19 family)